MMIRFKQYFLENKGLDNRLINAAALGDLEVVKRLFDDAGINYAGDGALRDAAKNGHLDVVKFLVEKGANIHSGNDYALRWSASNGHLEVVKYLLDNGVDLHANDDMIIQHVVQSGNLEMVKYLVSKMDPNYVISKLPKFIKYIDRDDLSHIKMADKFGVFDDD